MAPSSFAPNIASLSPFPNPPRRRRTANMSPVLCVPQRARPLFEGLRGLCVGVPATSLPPHRPRRGSASPACRRVPAPADGHGASCSRRPAPPPVRLRSCSLSSPHSPPLRFRLARCPSVGPSCHLGLWATLKFCALRMFLYRWCLL